MYSVPFCASSGFFENAAAYVVTLATCPFVYQQWPIWKCAPFCTCTGHVHICNQQWSRQQEGQQ